MNKIIKSHLKLIKNFRYGSQQETISKLLCDNNVADENGNIYTDSHKNSRIIKELSDLVRSSIYVNDKQYNVNALGNTIRSR